MISRGPGDQRDGEGEGEGFEGRMLSGEEDSDEVVLRSGMRQFPVAKR